MGNLTDIQATELKILDLVIAAKEKFNSSLTELIDDENATLKEQLSSLNSAQKEFEKSLTPLVSIDNDDPLKAAKELYYKSIMHSKKSMADIIRQYCTQQEALLKERDAEYAINRNKGGLTFAQLSEKYKSILIDKRTETKSRLNPDKDKDTKVAEAYRDYVKLVTKIPDAVQNIVDPKIAAVEKYCKSVTALTGNENAPLKIQLNSLRSVSKKLEDSLAASLDIDADDSLKPAKKTYYDSMSGYIKDVVKVIEDELREQKPNLENIKVSRDPPDISGDIYIIPTKQDKSAFKDLQQNIKNLMDRVKVYHSDLLEQYNDSVKALAVIPDTVQTTQDLIIAKEEKNNGKPETSPNKDELSKVGKVFVNDDYFDKEMTDGKEKLTSKMLVLIAVVLAILVRISFKLIGVDGPIGLFIMSACSLPITYSMANNSLLFPLRALWYGTQGDFFKDSFFPESPKQTRDEKKFIRVVNFCNHTLIAGYFGSLIFGAAAFPIAVAVGMSVGLIGGGIGKRNGIDFLCYPYFAIKHRYFKPAKDSNSEDVRLLDMAEDLGNGKLKIPEEQEDVMPAGRVNGDGHGDIIEQEFDRLFTL